MFLVQVLQISENISEIIKMAFHKLILKIKFRFAQNYLVLELNLFRKIVQ